MTVKELITELSYIAQANPEFRVVLHDKMSREGGQLKVISLTDKLPHHGGDWDIKLSEGEHVVVLISN